MNTELIKQKTEMLEEYFSIHVDPNGNLSRLPIVLDQYTPEMDRVPEFILCLGNDVSSLFPFPDLAQILLILKLYVFSLCPNSSVRDSLNGKQHSDVHYLVSN